MRHVAGSHNAQVANLSSTQLALYVAISALGPTTWSLVPRVQSVLLSPWGHA